MPGFKDAPIYPLGGPELPAARKLAGSTPRRAVLYTCNLPDCSRHAQILRANMGAIGIALEVRQFALGDMFTRSRTPGEPFDLPYSNWFVDYADPSGFINAVFGPDGANPGLFRHPEAERRMDAAARLTGDARLDAYADLDKYLAARRYRPHPPPAG